MKRKLLNELIEWQGHENRKPLILEGARQVGKTHLIKEVFAKDCFDDIVEINFERQKNDPDLIDLFSGDINPKRIIENLSLKFHRPIVPEKTLIFFDEVQEMPRALTSLKYFAEEAPEYRIVAAGSLLGIFLHGDVSFPVGKVDFLKLGPMDFEEFLIAHDMEDIIIDIKKSILSQKKPSFVAKLQEMFQEYLAVGGMPEAVKSWIKNKDILEVDRILKGIILSYKDDFSKHTTSVEANKISQIWSSIPAQFAKENHKFIYGVAKEGARARNYDFTIQWLVNAGVVYKVQLVPIGDKLPLNAYQDLNDFKLYTLDVGLLRVLAGLPSSVVVGENEIWSQFGGAFAEQYILQQLVALGVDANYYWVGNAKVEGQPKGKSEVDFITSNDKYIIPLEVKSGTNVRAKSLRVFRNKYSPKLAVRFSLKGLEYNDGLLNIPLYLSFCYKELLSIYLK